MKLLQGLGLSAVLLVAGCGGAMPSRSAQPYNAQKAESPAQDSYAPQGGYSQPGYPTASAGQGVGPAAEAAPSGERMYATPPPPMVPPLTTAGSMRKEQRNLVEDLLVAEAAVLNAGQDCAAACRALRSMQRAAAHLCSIASNDEERERCRAAQERVRSARERVRSSCRQCAGGPSLDPNAPIDEN